MALIDDLIRDECVDGKINFTPYRDTKGNLTIGIGTNLDAGITEDEARYLCQNRIAIVKAQIARVLPWMLYSPALVGARHDALCNMAFNMGFARLLGFHKMLSALKANDWQAAHDEALASEWAAEVGDRAKRIAGTFLTGEASG